MKKTLLILVAVLTASFAAMADVTINSTNFPDANFRSYLMSEYPSGVITTAQLNARDSLYLYNKGISNMKGVEYFTQLTYLNCYSNNLSSIDVSSNTKLKYLNLGYNKLTSISLTNNTALEQLYLQSNKLSTVSVSNYSNLRTLWVRDNTTLTGLYCWRDALTNVDVTGCTALRMLKIYNNYNLASITGLANCTALTWLDVEDTSFADLSAVEGMTKLETLLAGNTKITSLKTSHSGTLTKLELAGDTKLTQVICYSENLTTLKVSGCTALKNLRCYYNAELPAITGLADCTKLEYLDCEDCAISELPGVNNMNNLQTLWARNNQLTGTLEVSNKPGLQYLRVSGNTGLKQLRCINNELVSLDVTGCTALDFLFCEVNSNLTSITGLTSCTALKFFGCDYCAVSSLDMTFCPGLESLYCYNNQLTSLNVTGLTALLNFNCKNNPDLGEITGLSDCTALTFLDCSNCGLTSLTVNRMNDLQELLCKDNQITTLHAYDKPHLKMLAASNNSLLEEIYCFNCILNELYVDNCPALFYLDCQDNKLTALDVSICPSLMYLKINNNKLTQLDISNNPNLVCLWCNSNNLSSLDLSHCSDDFISLDCRRNSLSGTLDVSRFNGLYQVAIDENNFTQLILGDHPVLKDLWCYYNQLTGTLDVSGCSALESLDCSFNHLSGVRAEDCSNLHTVYNYINNVKAPQMGLFVDDLPTWTGDNQGNLYAVAIDYDDYTEGNVMTVAQVNEAHAKGWNVYYYNEDNEEWESYTGSAFIRGDVDDSGNVNIGDVTALINYLLSGDASTVNVSAADCDGNSHVNIGDVTALINFLLSGSWGNKAMAPAMNAQTQYTASSALTPHELRPLTLKMSQVKERLMRAKLVD